MGFNQETLGTKRGFEQRKSGFHQQWEFSCGTLAPPTDITAISGRVGKCYSIQVTVVEFSRSLIADNVK